MHYERGAAARRMRWGVGRRGFSNGRVGGARGRSWVAVSGFGARGARARDDPGILALWAGVVAPGASGIMLVHRAGSCSRGAGSAGMRGLGSVLGRRAAGILKRACRGRSWPLLGRRFGLRGPRGTCPRRSRNFSFVGGCGGTRSERDHARAPRGIVLARSRIRKRRRAGIVLGSLGVRAGGLQIF